LVQAARDALQSLSGEMAEPPQAKRARVAPADAPPPIVEYQLDQALPLSITIFGATGDLAKKKLFPALYQLILRGHFPKKVHIVGVGRKAVDMEEFVAKQCAGVVEAPELPKTEFCSRISFHAGSYDSPDAFEALDRKLRDLEGGALGNRLFFLSVPPSVFGDVCKMVSSKARAAPGGFTRLLIEKPFGRDSASFAELDQCTSKLFEEAQLFRLDHYLAKEVVLNMTALRFANQLFEPLWNAEHIESVEITFKEDLGTSGRGGYFDGFGIIRDIMQNHLLQIFMFIAMEPPSEMTSDAITHAKVELLRSVEMPELEKGVFLGQFTGASWHSCEGGDCKVHSEPGYLDDETVPKDSRCPTFAALVLRVNNERWRGVPFLMKAGKGLDEREAEVRVRFRPKPFNSLLQSAPQGNELVMRIQPDEALYLKTFSKEPGLEQVIKPTVMDMRYATQFQDAYIGDAYERMLLNAAKGDRRLFVSSAELVEAWRLFTPLLHRIDAEKPDVVKYPFGSGAPPGFPDWSLAVAGVPQTPSWQEYVALHADDVAKLKELFHALDKNRNGVLEATEVRELARQCYDGREPTQKSVDQIISRLDGRGDGSATFDDLLRVAKTMSSAFGVRESRFDYTGW